MDSKSYSTCILAGLPRLSRSLNSWERYGLSKRLKSLVSSRLAIPRMSIADLLISSRRPWSSNVMIAVEEVSNISCSRRSVSARAASALVTRARARALLASSTIIVDIRLSFTTYPEAPSLKADTAVFSSPCPVIRMAGGASGLSRSSCRS